MIWAGLHFPFHMALVLLMEGINQVFIWSHISEDLDAQIIAITNFPDNATEAQITDVANSTVNYVFNHFPSTDAVYNEVEDAIGVLNSTTATDNEMYDAYATIVNDIIRVIFEGFGWQTEEVNTANAPSGDLVSRIDEFYQQYLNVFSISFGKMVSEMLLSSCMLIFSLTPCSILLHFWWHRAHWNRHLHVLVLQGGCSPSPAVHTLSQCHLLYPCRHRTGVV
jgi:hypothetical protein